MCIIRNKVCCLDTRSYVGVTLLLFWYIWHGGQFSISCTNTEPIRYDTFHTTRFSIVWHKLIWNLENVWLPLHQDLPYCRPLSLTSWMMFCSPIWSITFVNLRICNVMRLIKNINRLVEETLESWWCFTCWGQCNHHTSWSCYMCPTCSSRRQFASIASLCCYQGAHKYVRSLRIHI